MSKIKSQSIGEVHKLYMDHVKTEMQIHAAVDKAPHLKCLYQILVDRIAQNKQDLKKLMQERHNRVPNTTHLKAIWRVGFSEN